MTDTPAAGSTEACQATGPPTSATGGGAQPADVRRELLLEARTDLQCGLSQSIPSDCQIMIARFRSALGWLDVLDKLAKAAAEKPDRLRDGVLALLLETQPPEPVDDQQSTAGWAYYHGRADTHQLYKAALRHLLGEAGS